MTKKLYRIFQHQSVSELENEIDVRMSDGWIPLGGVCIRESVPVHGEFANYVTYYQAMYKEYEET